MRQFIPTVTKNAVEFMSSQQPEDSYQRQMNKYMLVREGESWTN